MGKRMEIIGILIVIMLVSISCVSAINSAQNFEKKESPIFEVRTKQANYENSNKDIDIKYIGKNQFFLPFPVLEKSSPLSKSLTIRILGCTWMMPGCATWRYTCPFFCTFFGRTCIPAFCPTLTIC